MKRRETLKTLDVALNDTEKVKVLGRLTTLHGKLSQIEEEKKAAVDSFNADKKDVEKDLNELFRQASRSSKLAEVKCEEYLEEETMQVVVKRLDNNEIISVRNATEAEKQRELIFDEESRKVERKHDVLKEMLDGYAETVGRAVELGEIESWNDDQYRIVEEWALLKKYSEIHPAWVKVGDVPPILLIDPLETRAGETVEDITPESEPEATESNLQEGESVPVEEVFSFEDDNQIEVKIAVDAAAVPAIYARVKWNRETTELMFFKAKRNGKPIAVLEGKMVAAENVEQQENDEPKEGKAIEDHSEDNA